VQLSLLLSPPKPNHKGNKVKLADKYKPLSLNDVVCPDVDTRNLVTAIAQGMPPDHLILHGPFGTGKSALVDAMVNEATLHRNVDVVKLHGPQFDTKSQAEDMIATLIKRFSLVPWPHDSRILVIDEVDEMHKVAQQLLCQILDNPMYQTQVIMTTNYLEAIEGRLRDRADKVHMPYLPPDAWLDRAQTILQAEGVVKTDTTVLAALGSETGSIRGMMRVLEELCRQSTPHAAPPTTVTLLQSQPAPSTQPTP
jgi:DNA polymerase III delta prime subunit